MSTPVEFTHQTYPKPFIRLKPSEIVRGEIGAFAMMDFNAGDIIVRSVDFEDDNIMRVEEYDKLEPDLKELVMAHSTIMEDILYLPHDINFLRPINYFNHSCDPNTGFDADDNYVAIHPIRKDEEFSLDYSFLNTNQDYVLICHCGTPQCRRSVTGSEWKNPQFVKEREQYFASTVRSALARADLG